jgi:hypothetical protein
VSDEQVGEAPLAEYRINEAGKPDRKWTLLIFAERLEFESPDGGVREIAWDDRHERLQAHDRAFLMRRLVVAKLGKKQVMFQLEPDAFDAVKVWIGPLTIEDLKVCLKRQVGWTLPIGILFIITALPVGELPFEPVSFGLGLGLIFTALLAKIRPHRIFFALVSLWFCALAANSLAILINDWGWFRLILLVAQLLLAWRGIREYHRFAPAPEEPPHAG